MAKTIRDMAEEYADNREELFADEQQYCFESYKEGANAALELIAKELPKSDRLLNNYGKALLWRINERIKELKGE